MLNVRCWLASPFVTADGVARLHATQAQANTLLAKGYEEYRPDTLSVTVQTRKDHRTQVFVPIQVVSTILASAIDA